MDQPEQIAPEAVGRLLLEDELAIGMMQLCAMHRLLRRMGLQMALFVRSYPYLCGQVLGV